MTHFLNDPSDAVTESIDALIRLSGGRLTRLDGYPDIKVVRRAEPPLGHVAVISGGGAGHEPTHAGFVGAGLLTAAVSGEIFASPSVEAVLAAIASVDTGAGCLLIVKNYTGDRLNFGLAAERARAAGHQVEMVIVSDDVALKDSTQPRGIAGTLFVHKVAGAAAESGASLAEVTAAAAHAAGSVKTLGVSLSGADIPGRPAGREFATDSAELGLGIHGEPGIETISVGLVREIVARMATILEHELPRDAPVALLVNNLGGLSVLEISIAVGDLLETPLGKRAELLVGPLPLMTSLGMKGFSISAIPLDERIRAAVLSATEPTAAWPAVHSVGELQLSPVPVVGGDVQVTPSADPAVRAWLVAVSSALIENRERLDALDAQAGDGDTGSTFALAANRITAEIDQLPLADRPALLHRMGELVSVSMGGSSGVLISIMLTAAASALEGGSGLIEALESGAEAMQRYGGAKLGDRTMLDALLPALAQLSAGAGVAAAASAAAEGAAATAKVTETSAGRAAYVPSSHLLGVPDPGAEAVAVIFAAISTVLVG
jgi:triose/dihydroxyacetone kinase / FAD-AMP lyase (cyclizing)